VANTDDLSEWGGSKIAHTNDLYSFGWELRDMIGVGVDSCTRIKVTVGFLFTI